MRNLPYNRADRIARQIYQIAASFVCEQIGDERFSGLHITNARMTKDLSIARIYFYVNGGKEARDAAKKALDNMKPEIRHSIARELVLKTLPNIEFFVDEGIENAERIENILESLKT